MAAKRDLALFFLQVFKLFHFLIDVCPLQLLSYALEINSHVNFDALSWIILLICSRSLFAAMTPYTDLFNIQFYSDKTNPRRAILLDTDPHI